MTDLNIIIADDHPVILHGISDLLQQNLSLNSCLQVQSSTALIDALKQNLPDLLITDYHMPNDNNFSDGIKFIGYLRRNFPKLKIIVLTMLTNRMIAGNLYDLGVKALVYKNEPLKEVLKAVQTVLNDKTYYPSGFYQEKDDDLLQTLTPREFEVIRLFMAGFSVSKIAEHLHRSIKTISAQKKAAIKKLKLNNDQELIAFCNSKGLFLN